MLADNPGIPMAEKADVRSDELDLVEVWFVVRESMTTIIITTVIAAALAVAFSLMITPVFRAEVVVSEVESSSNGPSASQALLGQLGGLAGLAGFDVRGMGTTSMKALNLLNSRSFLEQFIAMNDLKPLIFAEDWNEQKKTWNRDIEHVPTLWEAAEAFKESIYSVSTDTETGLITVGIEWTDPQRAADWANMLVVLGNEIAREKDIRDAERSIAYLNSQVKKTSVIELQQVLYNLLQIEHQTLMLANARDEYILEVVDAAVVPFQRVWPHRTLIVILATIGGGIAGVLIVFGVRFVKALRAQAHQSAAEYNSAHS